MDENDWHSRTVGGINLVPGMLIHDGKSQILVAFMQVEEAHLQFLSPGA